MLIGIVHRWPAPAGVGSVLAKVNWEGGIRTVNQENQEFFDFFSVAHLASGI